MPNEQVIFIIQTLFRKPIANPNLFCIDYFLDTLGAKV